MKEENQVENSLIIIEKENIFTRLKKWIVHVFQKSKSKDWTEEPVITEVPSITIPKAVQMSHQKKERQDFSENSLEYLTLLSDEELEHLNHSYDDQIAEFQEEALKLNTILQNYQESIRKLQGQVAKEN